MPIREASRKGRRSPMPSSVGRPPLAGGKHTGYIASGPAGGAPLTNAGMEMTEIQSLKQLALADVENELTTTRRVLERIPEAHMAWKPHEKSMSLGALGTHISNLVRWQLSTLLKDEYDFAAPPPTAQPVRNRQDLLDNFDGNVAELAAALAGLRDEDLAREWTLRRGANVIMKGPKLVVFRTMGLSHIAHHRGQLTVYLRLLDVPLPPVYGPTADEGIG